MHSDQHVQFVDRVRDFLARHKVDDVIIFDSGARLLCTCGFVSSPFKQGETATVLDNHLAVELVRGVLRTNEL